jgi:hypothetical protein
LDDNPVYQALSYTWGDPNRVCTIILNGQKISVGTNLEEALQYFYSISYLGLLWVDAICINQNDNDEKNWQVQQMRDIYAQAEFVIAWLGAASDGSDLAMEKLAIAGDAIEGAVNQTSEIG